MKNLHFPDVKACTMAVPNSIFHTIFFSFYSYLCNIKVSKQQMDMGKLQHFMQMPKNLLSYLQLPGKGCCVLS